jgi:hypothetical protein
MAEAAEWLNRAGAAWDARLARLRDHLEGSGEGSDPGEGATS